MESQQPATDLGSNEKAVMNDHAHVSSHALYKNRLLAIGVFAAIVLLVLGAVAYALITNSISGATGIHKIKHIVIIMQENRSFDSYFGTFPGANGIPMQNGVPSVCVPDPANHTCVKPYHDSNDKTPAGPMAKTMQLPILMEVRWMALLRRPKVRVATVRPIIQPVQAVNRPM